MSAAKKGADHLLRALDVHRRPCLSIILTRLRTASSTKLGQATVEASAMGGFTLSRENLTVPVGDGDDGVTRVKCRVRVPMSTMSV